MSSKLVKSRKLHHQYENLESRKVYARILYDILVLLYILTPTRFKIKLFEILVFDLTCYSFLFFQTKSTFCWTLLPSQSTNTVWRFSRRRRSHKPDFHSWTRNRSLRYPWPSSVFNSC